MTVELTDWSAHYQWILNHIHDGVHIVDKQGETVFYNEQMAEIDGLSREQVLGENIFQIYPSLTNETSTLYLALQKGVETVEKIQTYRNMKGEQITSINSTYPLRQAGEIIGAVEIAKDITKIMGMHDQILELRKKLLESKRKQNQLLGTADYHFSDLIGTSPSFQQSIHIAKRAARTHSPVMICGDTGTGKELVAQSIHNASIRREGPFIAQNCAAVPKELMEGLLFGTTKGAFTGAMDRPGIFEQANGGTLFLDELNSLDLALQAKLLRVLQENKIRRIGGAGEQEIDVRVMAAMNVSPAEALEKGILRSDLYYRLNVVLVELPSLQERKEDIPLLIQHFIEKFNDLFGMNIIGISDKALQRLQSYNWPGNIRELSHAIESAYNIIDIGYDMIETHHLPSHIFESTAPAPSTLSRFQSTEEGTIDLPNMLEELERETIIEVFEQCNGNISKTAQALGLKRQALQYKLNKYDIQK